MKVHPSKEMGCWALVNLAWNADDKIMIAVAGGISVVVLEMKAQSGKVILQKVSGHWQIWLPTQTTGR